MSLRVCHESMPLQDSKDLQSTHSIAKGFHSHSLQCSCTEQAQYWFTVNFTVIRFAGVIIKLLDDPTATVFLMMIFQLQFGMMFSCAAHGRPLT